MEHLCLPGCACRVEIQAAADALADAAQLLSEVVRSGCADRIELRYALVRAAKSRLHGAMDSYRESRREAPDQMHVLSCASATAA